ncbi:MAG: hypothetical protein POELPBGB_04042 [Bacteroidia bacterium]|nr:hypothetical protein [Bacteroidia bacterium]
MARIVHLPGAQPAELLQLRIELAWLKPVIWRRVVVPEVITLAKLHKVIQAAMGWTDSHLYEFEIGRSRYGIPDPDWDMDEAVIPEKRITLAMSLAGANEDMLTRCGGSFDPKAFNIERANQRLQRIKL